ncbi:MAG: winged helix-turn-helix transcriptional regulator [Deltaproteobacteria bacterium]|nr:winged helix-turn-helix transcriptional regulator [Deltaproteobacteria bacterium]
MNNNREEQADDYRSFLLLDEISREQEQTQRDLSKKLGVALGLVNSYLKNLVAKGYVTVSTISRKRYKYFLTPSGIAEKTRLTYQHLQNFTNLYRVARRDFNSLFETLSRARIKRVVFCGVDEITEIAFLSLKESGIELAAVIDLDAGGNDRRFLGNPVLPFEKLSGLEFDVIIITSFQNGLKLRAGLRDAGIAKDRICDISSQGWLKKIELNSISGLNPFKGR